MTDPQRPEPDSAQEWVLGCSPSRTLVARRIESDGTVLVKIYESGSPSEPARELELGRRLAGPGIAPHLEAGIDPQTGKPCLVQELVPGQDLETLAMERGALPTRQAARIGSGLAAVLARLAAHRDPGAPAGFVHGDVKPSNVIVGGADDAPAIVLLDLEHAVAAPSGRPGTHAPGFTGGTHGFAPPEAYDGAPPTPAFDVFGLGAVLHVLLCGSTPFGDPGWGVEDIAHAVTTGRRRRWLLDGCPEVLCLIVDDCLAADPRARPSAEDVRNRLDAWLAAPDDDDARLLALAGRPLSALAAFGPDLSAASRKRLARRGRLVDALPESIVPDEDAPIDRVVRELEPALRALDALLLRFPLHHKARGARRAARVAAARLAVELPERLSELKRSARFGEARELCRAAADALGRAGRLPRPANATGTRPTLAERDPLRMVAMMCRDVESAAEAHDAVTASIRAAEAAADPGAVESAIEELARLYGGASKVVAAAKDRLSRFDFYLARIGQQAALVDELEPLLEELGVTVDLSAVAAFRRTERNRTTTRPRAMLRALADLTQEFPALADRVAPARAALRAALEAATRRGWEITADAERKLETPPIPIRPLTGMLARLDRMLQLDVLTDLPEGTRTDLHDHIEAVRTKIEQARAERDRITRGAQEAMDRGHLTTAIYDMARAVDRFGSEGTEGPGLAEQFEEAKQRKREIEESLERNHHLAARYGELVGDPTSLPAERLAVLHEREHLLSFLCANLGPERATAYTEDLRTVQLDVLREQSAEGELRFAAARGPEERLSIAQRTFDALQHAAPEAGWSQHEAREARELIQQWLETLESTAQEARFSRRARSRSPRPRRRLVVAVVSVATVIASAVAIGIALRGSTTDPVAKLPLSLGEPVLIGTAEGVATSFDATLALARLRDFVAELEHVAPEMTNPARECIAAVDAVDRGAAPFAEVIAAVDRLQESARPLTDARVAAAVGTFAGRALRSGFVAAVVREPSAALRRHLEQNDELRRVLSAEDFGSLDLALPR